MIDLEKLDKNIAHKTTEGKRFILENPGRLLIKNDKFIWLGKLEKELGPVEDIPYAEEDPGCQKS